jgi:molybdopterin-synthase adenylyltransferase
MARAFSDEEMRRYARHIVLKEVGGIGQAKLMDAKVLVVGAGGLGSPVLLYLAAAGIGTLGIIDDDTVDISNLQRQIAHTSQGIGRPKVESAAASVRAINPAVSVEAHKERLTAGNARALIDRYDLVADGSDNFATRFLLNDACYFARKPLVSAALLRFEGQLATFKAYLGGDNPCYRCLFPEAPEAGLVPTCSEAGILGAVAGVMGTLQATEILKEILAIGESLSGTLLIYDALDARFTRIRVKPDPACPLCGRSPTIVSLAAS